MNISTAWEGAAGRGDGATGTLAALLAAVQGRISRSFAARRRSRADCRAARLDDRILRDIGVTRLGLRETSLAGLNELGAGGR